ncbi:hypothetical protein [Methylocapsa aurea]|uniref:hypothetical protein n=1 Tax=Methylocapsa aurea TaxID=663610 RepID=UPI003D18F353
MDATGPSDDEQRVIRQRPCVLARTKWLFELIQADGNPTVRDFVEDGCSRRAQIRCDGVDAETGAQHAFDEAFGAGQFSAQQRQKQSRLVGRGFEKGGFE